MPKPTSALKPSPAMESIDGIHCANITWTDCSGPYTSKDFDTIRFEDLPFEVSIHARSPLPRSESSKHLDLPCSSSSGGFTNVHTTQSRMPLQNLQRRNSESIQAFQCTRHHFLVPTAESKNAAELGGKLVKILPTLRVL